MNKATDTANKPKIQTSFWMAEFFTSLNSFLRYFISVLISYCRIMTALISTEAFGLKSESGIFLASFLKCSKTIVFDSSSIPKLSTPEGLT